MAAVSCWRRNRRWVIFGVMSAASLLSYLHQVGLATVAGDVALSLGADASALALLSAAFAYPYAAMQVPAGLISDSLGPRRGVTVFLLVAAAGTALFASAKGLGTAMAGRALIGVGIAMLAVPFMKLTASWFPASDFGKVTAFSYTLGGAGFLLATTPMAWAAGLCGWRGAFRILAAAAVVCALLVWFTVRDAPGASRASGRAGRPASRSLWRQTRAILASGQIWTLGCWYFFQGGIYFSFVGLWGGQCLTRVLGMDPGQAGGILALPACAIMTAPFFNWLAARPGGRRKLFILLPLLSAALAVPLAAGVESWPPAALSVLFLAFAMTAIGGAAVLFAAGVDLFPVDCAGTVSGFINIFPFVGGAVFQQGIGWVLTALTARGASDAGAFRMAFAAYCAAGLAAAGLGLLYRDRGRAE